MLNKEVCMKCRVKLREHSYEWNEDDEMLWNDGYIFCKAIRGWYKYRDIPSNCPYKLEHILKGNQDVE